MCSCTGGSSCTWRRSRTTMGAASSGVPQASHAAGRCSTTASGVATRCSVWPRCPSCPPGFFPLFVRRLLGFRLSPSLEGGFPLLWLSLASRACSSPTCAANCSTCSRKAAFSASNSAIRASGVMHLCYTCSASPPDLLRAELAGAAAQPAHIFGERDRRDLERLRHRRVDVDQINQVVGGSAEAQRHRRLVDDLGGVHTEHRDANDAAGGPFEHHLDDAARITD